MDKSIVDLRVVVIFSLAVWEVLPLKKGESKIKRNAENNRIPLPCNVAFVEKSVIFAFSSQPSFDVP